VPKVSKLKLDLFKKSTAKATDRLDFLFGGESATATVEKPVEPKPRQISDGPAPGTAPTKALLPTIFKTRQRIVGLLETIIFGTLGLFSGLIR